MSATWVSASCCAQYEPPPDATTTLMSRSSVATTLSFVVIDHRPTPDLTGGPVKADDVLGAVIRVAAAIVDSLHEIDPLFASVPPLAFDHVTLDADEYVIGPCHPLFAAV